ncbi:4486_t:CDS:2 [Diversispora eburnea]|uniref:4486_t:CDS:1 n=1 Tax=Diversispora eburnea TaxID=1213867 RepID=A0A9N8WCE0_9GLOM|nr:4486_t:CDS:2 [Diversispora eburnea]
MADIGKQEGIIKPLPAPQRTRTRSVTEVHYGGIFSGGDDVVIIDCMYVF